MDHTFGEHVFIELFDPETSETREVASLGEWPSLYFGLSVSPDGKWILYTQNDHRGSDIMRVAGFVRFWNRIGPLRADELWAQNSKWKSESTGGFLPHGRSELTFAPSILKWTA